MADERLNLVDGLQLHLALVQALKDNQQRYAVRLLRRVCALPEADELHVVRGSFERFINAGLMSHAGRPTRRFVKSVDGFWLACRNGFMFAGREGYVFPIPIATVTSTAQRLLDTWATSLTPVGLMIRKKYLEEVTVCSSSD